jgi:hypothetical protein
MRTLTSAVAVTEFASVAVTRKVAERDSPSVSPVPLKFVEADEG